MYSDIESKGKYLVYLLSRSADLYEDFPNDKTLKYEDFKKQMLNNIEKNGNIAK